MTQGENFEELVVRLYTLLGHQVENVVRYDEFTSDIIIKSNKGERWLARCCQSNQINEISIRDIIRVAQIGDIKQAALITNGDIASQYRQLIEGKAIYLLDGKQFQDYLMQAQVFAQKKSFSQEKLLQQKALSSSQASSTQIKLKQFKISYKPALVAISYFGITVFHNLISAINALALAVGIISMALATRNKRLLNGCDTCGYTWYPRGKDISYKCPRCGSTKVQFAPGARAVGYMLIIMGVAIILFYFLSPRR